MTKRMNLYSSEQRLKLRHWLRRSLHPAWLGTLRRVTPLSNYYGYDRGYPIDRYYIEGFLEQNRACIRGRVLEVKDSAYTNQFGIGVERRDVLDINPANHQATIVADLSRADSIPAASFDCFILTQTLQFILDTRAALSHSYRILKPGGTLLATVPSISRIELGEAIKHDYWRFTAASCQALFGEVFGNENISIYSFGNVLSTVAFLMGMACEEVSSRELDARDEYYPLVIAVKAVKGEHG